MSKLLPSLAMLRSRWLGCPLALMLTSTWALAQDKRWGPGEPASDYGYRFTDMFWLITILTSVSFGVVVLLLVIPVLRHRERPGRRASFDHGTSLHDKRLTAFISVAIFIVLDAWVLVIAMTDLREAYWAFPDVEDPQTYRVEVLAQQWAWNFRTPGVDGEFGTADDILSINELVVPLDRPVSFNMTSKDVIHALFLPEMRLKRDVNPGSINKVWFKPIIAGDFTILCAELCGFAHYQMFGKLRVLEQDLFNQWEAEASRLASTAFDADDTEARWAWDWQE
jgi:cytochrome c oxidase subunit 2